MKRVLMLDPSPIFRDFLKEKLAAAGVSVDVVQGRGTAFAQLLSLLPDLILIDVVEQDFSSTIEFLERKRANPNTVSLPVIVVGPAASSGEVVGLAQLGGTKYFARPFAMDALIKTCGILLGSPMQLDTTPAVLEAHKNKNVLVVDAAIGLNLDKIAMLKYYLADLISNHAISSPKILIIFSNMNFSFVDGINLEKFFDNVLRAPRVTKKEVKVLARDSFVKQFIEGHTEYAGMQTEDNLAALLNSLVESAASCSLGEVAETRLLSVDKNTLPCYTKLTFDTDIAGRKRGIARQLQ